MPVIQVKLLEPLLGILRIARLEVEDHMPSKLFTHCLLLLSISDPQQDFHPD